MESLLLAIADTKVCLYIDRDLLSVLVMVEQIRPDKEQLVMSHL
jgi:hypothetical protein